MRRKKVLLLLTIPSISFLCFVCINFSDSYTVTRSVIRTPIAPSVVGMRAPARRSQDDSNTGRVIVLRFSGQQGAGVKALSSLQQWIRDVGLPVSIVEPRIQHSVLGIYCDEENVTVPPGVTFGEMFDLDNFNTVSRREGLPEIVTWSSYVEQPLTQSVRIYMKQLPRNSSFPPPNITSYITTDTNVTVQGIGVALNVLRNVTAYYKYANHHSLSKEDLNNILQGLDPKNLTLVFSLWRGPWRVETASTPSVRDQSTVSTATEDELKYRDSKKLLQSASVYQERFLNIPQYGQTTGKELEKRYVSLMIRSEHSVLQFLSKKSKNTSRDLQECMKEVVRKTEVALKIVGTKRLLVTSDVGKYGSTTWEDTVSSSEKGDINELQEIVKRGVEKLYRGRQGWNFEQWEQSFVNASGGIDEKGYVAALQRVLAAHQNTGCMVLVGGGLFQELSLERYLQHNTHQHSCIHLLCMQRKYRKSFRNMINKHFKMS